MSVERHYENDYDTPNPLAVRAEYELDHTPMDVLLARLTGRTPERARDLLDAQRERRAVDDQLTVERALAAARAEKAAERAEALAAWEFTHHRLGESRARLEEARQAREEATAALAEACVHDSARVAELRRRVRS